MRLTIPIRSAQLPASSDEDRLVVTPNSIAVLDGATTHFAADGPTGGDYAEQLGQALGDELRSDEAGRIEDILKRAMEQTIAALALSPNAPIEPSSTVAIVRAQTSGKADALVLGDSTIVFGYTDGTEEVLSDRRLGDLNLAESREYRARLRAGHGYDDTHRALLSDLQHAQAQHRNRPDGYWIASTDPDAAHRAISVSRPVNRLRWVIVATDGAAESLPSLGITWEEVGTADSEQLSDLLRRCEVWEQTVDPNGSVRPRSKRHDDKTVAVFPFN